jgi:phytoene dehydrogenase-like protein
MNKKVIIIGGGVAGLSAGIYGQLNGYDTEIIEMHTIPGGQCTAWTRKGYRFDYCLHWLVGTSKGAFHDVWKETNVVNEFTKIIDHEIHTKIINENGDDFIVYTSIDRWEKYMIDLAPEDSIRIKKMCNDMRKGSYLEPFTDPPELRKMSETLKAMIKIFPALLLMIRYGKKNCKEYFQKLNLKNPRLSLFFNTLYTERDFSALAFLMMLCWFNQKNAGYIIGGSLPLAERMADRYKSLGGTLTLGRKVNKIIVEEDRARGVSLIDETEIPGDYVISAADGHSTIFDMLKGKYISKEVKEAYESWDLFTPIVQVSFGINKKITTESPVITYLSKGKKIGTTILSSGYTIMNYSFDPTMAPDGKTVIVIRFESPWELWKDLDGDRYKTEKELIKTDSTTLLERNFPGITNYIEVVDIATPKTNVEYTSVWKGSYEGFMPSSKNISKNL